MLQILHFFLCHLQLWQWQNLAWWNALVLSRIQKASICGWMEYAVQLICFALTRSWSSKSNVEEVLFEQILPLDKKQLSLVLKSFEKLVKCLVQHKMLDTSSFVTNFVAREQRLSCSGSMTPPQQWHALHPTTRSLLHTMCYLPSPPHLRAGWWQARHCTLAVSSGSSSSCPAVPLILQAIGFSSCKRFRSNTTELCA